MAGLLGSIGSGLLGLIGGIASGIVANKAHQKYANELMNVQMQMPSAVGQAEGIYNRLANQNIPGYQDMLQGLQSGVASQMTQAEQASSSPTAILNALAGASTRAQQGAQQLGIQNANYRTQGEQNLANFLGTTKAGYENQINQFNVDKQISAMKERMLGTQQLMQGITGGIGSAFSNFGQSQQLGMQQEQANAMSDFYKSIGLNSGATFGDVLGGGGSISPMASLGGGMGISGLATAGLL